MNFFFVSDLHGNIEKYNKLFKEIFSNPPSCVLFGGDLLPHRYSKGNFILDFLAKELLDLKELLLDHFPKMLVILGNDDARLEEKSIYDISNSGLIEYIHGRKTKIFEYDVYGYCFTPPSPFLLKDWEKYDVSRYTDPGCISPEEGKRTVEVPTEEAKFSTIKKDLEELTLNNNLLNAIFLFHAPPYKTNLDRAALDGKFIDHLPLDVHVGSIAIKKFIEERQPLITLHGHIHESAHITGSWREKIGRTYSFSAAHHGSELAIVKFDPENPAKAERILL
jgi:Icc-related predicted phosphoesterase